MSALFKCERCDIPLIDHVDRDSTSLSRAFLMSALASSSGCLALNILRPDATCPVCGAPQSFTPGPAPPLFKRLQPPGALPQDAAHALLTHAQEELRGWLDRVRASGQQLPSLHYILAHVALRYYVFGTMTCSGTNIGLANLLNEGDAAEIFRTLRAMVVNGDQRPPLEIDGIKVRAGGFFTSLFGRKTAPSAAELDTAGMAVHPFEITGASCVVVQFPPPKAVPEAHFTAIVLGSANTGERPPLRYFTLEHGKPQRGGFPRTYLCEWMHDGRRHNFGPGPPANVEDLVECLDRVFVAGK